MHRAQRHCLVHRPGWSVRLRWPSGRHLLCNRFAHGIYIRAGRFHWSMSATLYQRTGVRNIRSRLQERILRSTLTRVSGFALVLLLSIPGRTGDSPLA